VYIAAKPSSVVSLIIVALAQNRKLFDMTNSDRRDRSICCEAVRTV